MKLDRNVWIGGLSAGMALFVWGVVAFTLFPLQQNTMRTLPAEDRIVDALRESGAPAGVYVFPGLAEAPKGDQEAKTRSEELREDKLRRGPRGILVFDPSGIAPNRMFRPLLKGFIASLLAGTFAAWALSRARIRRHRGRVAFVVALGAFGWLLGPASQGAWFSYPVEYLAASLAEALIGWTIVGVVLAGIVRPRPTSA